MTKKYDLVIVGGGPAGLTAAKFAGENGLKTALLDRKTDIPKIRRVDGGVLSPINEYTFSQTVVFNPRLKKICFPASGFSVPYDGPYRNVFGFAVYSPGGKKFTFGDRPYQKQSPDQRRAGVTLDKELLLRGLLADAQANGVDVFPGTNVTGVEKQGDTVIVTGNGEQYECAFCIAADGVNSRLVRHLGLNRERKFFATHNEMIWYLEGIEIPEVEGICFVFTMDGSFFVSSSLQKGHYHVGVTTHQPADDLNAKIEKFVYEDKVYSPWFKGAKKTGASCCIVNMHAPMKEPFKDNVLIISDAAWLMEVSNAIAMVCGWKAANAVTLALLEGKPNRDGLASYFDWWQKYFYEPYGEMDFKPIELQDFFDADDLDYLVGLVKEPRVATMDFYKLIGTIGNTYGELFPTIGEERPDVMAKLMGVLDKMEEAEEASKKAGFPNK
jgi:digeranylgeranylglycerophospholipid reductase